MTIRTGKPACGSIFTRISEAGERYWVRSMRFSVKSCAGNWGASITGRRKPSGWELLILTRKDAGRSFCSFPRKNGEETRQESRWTKQEAEAHLIAARIRELLKTGTVTEDGELRPARCGDIVILLRTMAGWSETFVRVLQEEGIPASAQSREGYFQTVEVEGLLSYLRVLDNPTQEIPLAAALHGSIGGFSSEELAKIKAGYRRNGSARPARSMRRKVRMQTVERCVNGSRISSPGWKSTGEGRRARPSMNSCGRSWKRPDIWTRCGRSRAGSSGSPMWRCCFRKRRIMRRSAITGCFILSGI